MSQKNLNEANNEYNCQAERGNHAICRNRLEMFGGDGKCCRHSSHPNCLLDKKHEND